MHTGDAAWVGARYESLKPKILLERARADGLLVSNEAQVRRNDIVDWPAGERDGFVFKPVNTVVNAFHIHTLVLMAELATALGKDADAADYRAKAARARAAFQAILFGPELGRSPHPRFGALRNNGPFYFASMQHGYLLLTI